MNVVDDQLLTAALSDYPSEPDGLLEPIAVTLTWHYRAARAINSTNGNGVISRKFRQFPEYEQTRVRALINDLPSTITTVDPRNIVPVMTALSTFGPANLLALEAVATALVLDATLAVTTTSPMLERVAKGAGVEINVIAL